MRIIIETLWHPIGALNVTYRIKVDQEPSQKIPKINELIREIKVRLKTWEAEKHDTETVPKPSIQN